VIHPAEDVAVGAGGVGPGRCARDADAISGMAAKKPLAPEPRWARRDLASGPGDQKDEMVSVRFRTGGVSLSLQGKALGPASEGQPVRVQNLQSKAVIEAIAAGPGLAVVGREAEALKSPRLAQK
jgi:flagella basal body P-ring formation protein FlgA